MADKAPQEAPQELPQPTKPKWLAQVEADAVRITLKRMKDEEDERQYQKEQEEAKK